MDFWVYVIRNNQTGKIYIGQTNDTELRIKRHNADLPTKKTSFTNKNRVDGIWELIYTEKVESRKAALKREKELKFYQGRQFIKAKCSISSKGRSASG